MMPKLGLGLMLIALDGRGESVLHTGVSPDAASAHLDFRIVVPRVVRLDAERGSLMTNARPNETVLIAIERDGTRNTVASRADRVSVRRASLEAPAASLSPAPATYTVVVP